MGVRVLVVDDDPLVLRSVERILTRASYEVVTALDVREAVRYSSNIQMDAALVDYALANETGLQVLARLREIQPSCLRVLMTGHTDFPMVVEAVNRGEVLRVVRKPFEASALLQTLEDAFASARRMAEVRTAQQKAVDFQERMMLEECLENELLRLAVQPIVTAGSTNDVVAYECLMRSQHPVLDGPLAVLRVAERNERMQDLGAVVFRLATDWLERIPSDIGLFINVAADQLSDASVLAEHIEPLVPYTDRVTLEITEQSNMAAIDGWERSIDLVRNLGFHLAVDDLGAGYNSLSILADLQPRYIKLDMSLVRNLHLVPRKQRLVQMMATFAEATNSLVIGEGVENRDEMEALLECGVHLLQGYHFARPSIDEAPLLARQRSAS